MYCIYTGKDVAPKSGNLDHVIPLSLGGRDQFCVWSERAFNSKLGEKIDGAVANDPLVMFARREADARGHSGVEPVPVWRKSEFEGRPVQVRFGKDGLQIWDAKSRAYLEEDYTVGKPIKSELRMDRFAPIRFAAKVALGGAYFIYGDIVRKCFDCDELRRLISLDVQASRVDPKILGSKVTIRDRFHPDAIGNPDGAMYKALCEFTQRSTLICIPHHGSVAFHIGVLGVYMATIFVPADTDALPMDADLHDLGHVILLEPGDMERLSLRQLAARWYKLHTGEEPPPPPE